MELYENEEEYLTTTAGWYKPVDYLLKNSKSHTFTRHKDYHTYQKVVVYTFDLDPKKETIYRLKYGHITSSSI